MKRGIMAEAIRCNGGNMVAFKARRGRSPPANRPPISQPLRFRASQSRYAISAFWGGTIRPSLEFGGWLSFCSNSAKHLPNSMRYCGTVGKPIDNPHKRPTLKKSTKPKDSPRQKVLGPSSAVDLRRLHEVAHFCRPPEVAGYHRRPQKGPLEALGLEVLETLGRGVETVPTQPTPPTGRGALGRKVSGLCLKVWGRKVGFMRTGKLASTDGVEILRRPWKPIVAGTTLRRGYVWGVGKSQRLQ